MIVIYYFALLKAMMNAQPLCKLCNDCLTALGYVTSALCKAPSSLASPGSRPSITIWVGKERSNVRGQSVYSSKQSISSPNAVKT